MSHFYGTLSGKARTRATRTGTKSSGIETVAASWDGAINVNVYNHRDDSDRFTVHMIPWNGLGDSITLVDGKLGDSGSVSVDRRLIKKELAVYDELVALVACQIVTGQNLSAEMAFVLDKLSDDAKNVLGNDWRREMEARLKKEEERAKKEAEYDHAYADTSTTDHLFDRCDSLGDTLAGVASEVVGAGQMEHA